MNENDKGADGAFADVGQQRIARVYAEALLNAAERRGQAQRVFDELDSLVGDVFPAAPDFEAFLSSRAVSREAKPALIRRALEGRASDVFLNFLLVLNQHQRLDLLRPVRAAYRDLWDERARRIRVQVRSAVPLAEDQSQRLREELRRAFRRDPILETRVDPDLIGGLVVQVGDYLYDGSVRSRLTAIRNQLIERSSYEIQSRRDRFCTDARD
jgi:F-type H+-transporting ATPase subunit delta